MIVLPEFVYKSNNITHMDKIVYGLLSNNDEVSLEDISKSLSISRTSASKSVNRLCENKYIEITRSITMGGRGNKNRYKVISKTECKEVE